MPDYRVDVFVGEQASTDFHARNAAIAQLSKLYGGVTVTKTTGGWVDNDYPVYEYGRCFTVILTDEDEFEIQAEARHIVHLLGECFRKEKAFTYAVSDLLFGKTVTNSGYEDPDE